MQKLRPGSKYVIIFKSHTSIAILYSYVGIIKSIELVITIVLF